MIQIYDINDNLIYDAPLTEGCERVQELMAADHIQLSFKAVHSFTIPAGAYIDWFGIYRLLEPYTPTQQSEAEYLYTPQFHAEHITWKKYPFFFYTDEKAEPDWSLTGNATLFLDCVTMALQKTFGQSWHYSVASDLPASAYVAFQNTDIFSGLNAIAEAFKTEWYADLTENRIYLGHVSRDEQAVLEVGKNVNVPSVTANSDAYFNRFYAFGSTRNIPQNYVGANTQNVVNKRLTLDPAKYPDGYKDIKDLKSGEEFATNLFFDNIYPRATEGTEGSKGLAISNVRERRLFKVERGTPNKIPTGETDENGNPIYEMYSIWYFNIASLEFSKSMIIEGTDLTCAFESGALQGREFVLGYHEEDQKLETADGTPFYVYAGDYEILYVEENGITIPTTGVGLIPADGDEVALFNLKLPDSYVEIAYKELEAALDEEIARRQKDFNSYTFKSNPVAFAENDPNLYLGRAVKFINSGNALDTRITKLTYKLDSESSLFPNEMTITIGEKRIKGSIATLKEEVVNANRNIDLLATLNKQTTSIQEAYKRTQDAILQGFNRIANMWQLDDDGNVYSKFNVYTLGWLSTKGISANEDGGGTGIDISRMWEELASDDPTKLIDLSHMPSSVKTAVNWVSSVTGSDADSQINKWNEIVSFLSGISDTSSLSSILRGKANASAVEELSDDVSALNTHITNILARKVNAGTGLTGGGTLNDDVTLSLATIGKAGTYTKVVVDAYGRVTGNSALLASDIPQLEMGQINGLANELEVYSQLIESSVQESEFAAFFAQEMAKWFVLDSENKGIKTANGYGFYSESYISSKGLSNETGTGGSGVALSTVWDSLANNTDVYGSTKIHLDHIPSLTKSKISDFPTLVSAFANDAGYITASAIINKADKATTLAGYGITDAVPFLNMVNASNLKSIGVGYVNANGANGENGGIISFGFASYQTQIHSDHSGGNIHWRVNSNGTLTNWKNLLDANNYSNYAVTLDTSQTILGTKTLSANLLSATRGTLDIGDEYNSFNRIFAWHYKPNSLTKPISSSGKWYRIWNFSQGVAGTFQKNAIISINKAYNHEQGQTITLAVSINNWGQTYVINQLSGTTGLITKVRVTGKWNYSYVDVYISSAENAESYSVSGYGNGERVDFEELADDATNDSTRTEELTVVNGTAVNYPLSLQNATPLVVNSTTMVANLNANYLGGFASDRILTTHNGASHNLAESFTEKSGGSYVMRIGGGNAPTTNSKYGNILHVEGLRSDTSWELLAGWHNNELLFRSGNTSADRNGIISKKWKSIPLLTDDTFSPSSGTFNVNSYISVSNSLFCANGEISLGTDGLNISHTYAYMNIGDYLTVNGGSTEIHGDYFRIGAVSTIFTNSVNINGNVNLSSMMMTNNDTGVLTLDGNYIDVYAPMNVKTSLTIGQATISWDSVNGMLKVDKGAYFTGPVSTKGASSGTSGMMATAQFGVEWNESWTIDSNEVTSLGNVSSASILASQGSTNGSSIHIVCDAFTGKKVSDIEIFTLGWEGEYPADARLVPYKIVGNELSCKLYLTGTMTPILFKIKIY